MQIISLIKKPEPVRLYQMRAGETFYQSIPNLVYMVTKETCYDSTGEQIIKCVSLRDGEIIEVRAEQEVIPVETELTVLPLEVKL